MAAQGSIDKLQKYLDRIDFLKDAYKKEEYRAFLDKRIKQKHSGYTDFGQWLRCIEDSYLSDLTAEELIFYPNRLLHQDKCDISMFYNDIKELQGGSKTYSRKVQESIKNWNKPYLKKKVGTPVDKDDDFYSLDVFYFFRSTLGADEAKELINSNRKEFRKDSIESAYMKLQGSKIHRNIPENFLEIKNMIYRSYFQELIITVGLKDSILKIKEEMQEV